MTVDHDDWGLVQRRVIAKAIAELAYEQVIEVESPDGAYWSLKVDNGISYAFGAWQTIWDFLRIDAQSLRRIADDGDEELDAARFYREIRPRTRMSDMTFANFIDELQRTLYGDLLLLQSRNDSPSFADLSDDDMQSLLEGHPKILLNKGRVGWGKEDWSRYSPESRQHFALNWIAVRNECLTRGLSADLSWTDLLAKTMGPESLDGLLSAMEREQLPRNAYTPMPVHPWQWDNVVALHHLAASARRDIVSLGIHGDHYRPQTSLRTLSNIGDPRRYQIKLSLSVLNTSCIRGISGQYIDIAPALSEKLQTICEQDRVLVRTRCLRDRAGAFVAQPDYHAVPAAPYRFLETLGAIWRESPVDHLAHNERCVPAAALHQKDGGRSLASTLISRSALPASAWVKCYAQEVIVPLYHLQVKYGIGLVAHGQNITLRLIDGVPSGIFLKDFQGDLRLAQDDRPELDAFACFGTRLTRLPAQHLIHDLLTGHFVTVLRFMSACLAEDDAFPETEFYRIVACAIDEYHAAHPELAPRWSKLGLDMPTIARVVVNRVRFQIGYGDSDARPLPTLGTDLQNPLFLSYFARKPSDEPSV
ncbi:MULTISPECIES: IucA/IucC family protein [unclassified Variovorax]|uniref:IucA/IucC family protein n=1 Tax=unclassified Variovorax TaxID=663243 RepID=UPI00076CFB9C|nr:MULTISPECIES: IucA/IucC family protein [unclassified Variovorax]KWT72599.1 Citrate:6-N-acetyl-6-N-hydroxy-L-lysine ligase alpha subunit [Variovorax sp. WDL1]PNG58416.1 Aerobactin synthase [Variovorax sp. B4]PNG61794.1 Aerobactin synthase [Variovorax sp. B2]VTV12145.1 Aerobactin synthase [Variovorax sp. WDL1]